MNCRHVCCEHMHPGSKGYCVSNHTSNMALRPGFTFSKLSSIYIKNWVIFFYSHHRETNTQYAENILNSLAFKNFIYMVYNYLENMNIISCIIIIIIFSVIIIIIIYLLIYLFPQLSNGLVLYVHIRM